MTIKNQLCLLRIKLQQAGMTIKNQLYFLCFIILATESNVTISSKYYGTQNLEYMIGTCNVGTTIAQTLLNHSKLG